MHLHGALRRCTAATLRHMANPVRACLVPEAILRRSRGIMPSTKTGLLPSTG
jgi:hypothetical protein